MAKSELAVITKAKDLCSYVMTVTEKSPKRFRFTLTSRLQNYALDVIENLFMANETFERVEAIEIVVLPKGKTPAKEYDAKKASYVGGTTCDAHVQTTGWTGRQMGLSFGTTGKAKRLEAIKLTLAGEPYDGGIEYDVHCQTTGWQATKADGELAGTTGKAKRLEAVRVRLTGDEAKRHLSVWYRVHSQTFGWLGWACDGDPAGTTGLAKRAEAIEVQVLPKGAVPDGYDASVAACRTK